MTLLTIDQIQKKYNIIFAKDELIHSDNIIEIFNSGSNNIDDSIYDLNDILCHLEFQFELP